jgi:hypothetical protein
MDSDPQINISHIKVAGVGGFGLVVVVAAMAIEMPAVRGFVLAGIAGGLLGAAALLLFRRWTGLGPVGPGSIFKLDARRPAGHRHLPERIEPFDRIERSTAAGW